MKITKEYIIPEKKDICVESIKCDLCGKISPERDGWGYNGSYSSDVEEITIEYKSGSDDYTGSSDYTITSIDLCPGCFMEKLVPWIKSLGGNVNETKTSS